MAKCFSPLSLIFIPVATTLREDCTINISIVYCVDEMASIVYVTKLLMGIRLSCPKEQIGMLTQ